MGGLVIKRAITLVKQNNNDKILADRARSIVFLATPHRGSDLASLFSKVLGLSSGARPFVTDLHRNSIATESINDEFPHYCQDLQLYSFYETLPTSYGLGRNLIVEKDLAVLGYHNERSTYLNADHRGICKFASPNDPNYQAVRNTLASIIDNNRTHAEQQEMELSNDDYNLIYRSLGPQCSPEDDLADAEAIRLTGSCGWLLGKKNFLQWRDDVRSCLYWISAKPATGKTVMTGMVITHLRSLHKDVAFHFFDCRNKSKTTINAFLLSIAWQMSLMHSDVLQAILDVCKRNDQLFNADNRTIWRKLFLDGVFRLTLHRPYYWVIDALDECRSETELTSILYAAVETGVVRIFLTSRGDVESQRIVKSTNIEVLKQHILEEDTKQDIELYLKKHTDDLPVVEGKDRYEMVQKILDGSAGCFLWVSLILEELRQVHTSAETRQIFENTPLDMNGLYQRILDSMSSATHGKKLTKAIITWVVCSSRPLTKDELHHALELNLNDKVDNIEKSINSSCGNLIHVDGHSNVQLIHKTARDFLLQVGNSEFAVDKKLGHKQIGLTCLQYLNGNEMRSSKHKKLSARSPSSTRGPFIRYASRFLFDHLNHVQSTDDEIFYALSKFFESSNVLSWIEYVTQESNLYRLIIASKAIENFLKRRSNDLSPLGREVALLNAWSIDLGRLVTKFGKQLLAYPPAIFHLIPPFCPPKTALRRQFASKSHGITVAGLALSSWDDCIATIDNPNQKCLSIACSQKFFAVGLSSGNVLIYDTDTCQEYEILQHGESVKCLHFHENRDLLASTGARFIRVWQVEMCKAIWSVDIPVQCLSVAFYHEQGLFLGALRNNRVVVWDLETGAQQESIDWTSALEGPDAHAYRRPIAAAFSVENGLLAILYRGQDVVVWDLEQDSLYGIYSKETGVYPREAKRASQVGALSVVFGTDLNSDLLAAAYSDGDLVLFDTSDGTVKATSLMNAQTLACSPQGRTLACVGSSSAIQILEFDTLKLLYRINLDGSGCQGLVFSQNGSRLLDLSGSKCRVWDPMVLVRQDGEEDNSDIISVSTTLQESNVEASDDEVLITSMACHPREDFVFCGKEDGSVYVYETKSGLQYQKLFSHADGVSILSLMIHSESNVITSVDSSSRIIAQRLVLDDESTTWKTGEILFDRRAVTAVEQVLLNPYCTRLLICTSERDTLWSLPCKENSNHVAETVWTARVVPRWATHPTQKHHLISLTPEVTHLYDWHSLAKLTGVHGIVLMGDVAPNLLVQAMTPCFGGKCLSTVSSTGLRQSSKTNLLLWNPADFAPNSNEATPIPEYRALAEKVQACVGEYRSQLVFLHGSGWVCSATSNSSIDGSFIQHFFLPADWLNTNMDLLFGVTHKGDFIFVKRHELGVVKNGLKNRERVSSKSSNDSVKNSGKRSPLICQKPSSAA